MTFIIIVDCWERLAEFNQNSGEEQFIPFKSKLTDIKNNKNKNNQTNKTIHLNMSIMMKALLACMPATAVLAMGNTEVIEITESNMSGTDFHLEMGDTLEFHWKGPG